MPTISKPALQNLYNKLAADPNAKLDENALDDIVAIVGDKKGTFGIGGRSSEAVAQKLQQSNLSREEKLKLALEGLDNNEKQDIHVFVADATISSRIDPVVLNFLKALIGLEALRNPAHVEGPRADPNSPEVQAATKMRELIKTNKLRDYYDAAIGAVDNPALKQEALDLFSKLPTVKPGMSADDFVRAGLWTVPPRGIAEMQKSARYLPGRQVLIETNVFASTPPGWSPYGYHDDVNRKIGTYDKTGPVAVTHRATLVGEDPQNKNNFLVNVDGKTDGPVSVPKEMVYRHNHPHQLDPSNIHSDTKRTIPWGGNWQIDYASPLAKAKLCEIALKMDEHVQKLDFTKLFSDSVIDRSSKTVEIQKKCNELVFRSIDMRYPRDDGQPFTDAGRCVQGERDVARQAIRGTGMCVQQSCVYGALLMPFMEILGIDGQYRSGNCFRNIKGEKKNVFAPDSSTGHGWWQVTFRPSMEMSVTDRTWDQVNLTLDRAYGFPRGDRYADRDIWGYSRKPLSNTDVNVSGNISVETFERQFAREGDGRENHISRLNNDG
jgi:hypothetical protein